MLIKAKGFDTWEQKPTEEDYYVNSIHIRCAQKFDEEKMLIAIENDCFVVDNSEFQRWIVRENE